MFSWKKWAYYSYNNNKNDSNIRKNEITLHIQVYFSLKMLSKRKCVKEWNLLSFHRSNFKCYSISQQLDFLLSIESWIYILKKIFYICLHIDMSWNSVMLLQVPSRHVLILFFYIFQRRFRIGKNQVCGLKV